jgi:predicted XRE-type DNA-binding protein
MADEEIKVVHSSGNIFADLNLPEPEELLAKAALGLQIRDAIVERGWTQVQAAAALGIPQPKVSALMGARLSGFSIERLLRLLLRLDRDIEIVVRPKRDKQPRVRVA